MTFYPSLRFVIASVTLCGCIVTTNVYSEEPATREQDRRFTAAEVMKRAHDVRAEWTDFSGFNVISVLGNQDHTWACGGTDYCDDTSEMWKYDVDDIVIGTTIDSVM